jgi:hypothetical protein
MLKVLLKFLPLIIHEGFELLKERLEKRAQKKVESENLKN